MISSISVRNLDLSNNVFGGKMAIVIGRLLQQNQLLMNLNLASSKLTDDVWEAIGSGLTQNKTLLFLDISFCEMTLKSAETICKALESNDTCSVDMRQNPLPRVMIQDPRQYHKNKRDEGDTGTAFADAVNGSPKRRTRGTGNSPTKSNKNINNKGGSTGSHSEKSNGSEVASEESGTVEESESGTMMIPPAPAAAEAYKSDFSHLGGISADLSSIHPKPLDPEAAGSVTRLT
jgi:hypothetical protein